MAKVRVAVLGTVGKSVIVDTELNTRVSALESAVNALTQRAVGAGSKNRHGDLSGLQNDDHPQYTMWQAAEKITGQWQWTRQLWGPDGSAAAPSFSFTSDPDTGWYRVGANNPGIAVGGVKTWDLNSTRSLQIVPMTVAMTVADNVTQSLIYASATNPGGTDIDVFEVSAPMTSGASSAGMRMAMWDVYPGGAGARGFRWDMTQAASSPASFVFYAHHNNDTGSQVYSVAGNAAQLVFVAGTSSVPPVALNSGSTGFFWDTTNSAVGITLSGAYTYGFRAAAFVCTVPEWGAAGTASMPGYAFALDSGVGLGMYRVGANQLGFSTSSTLRLTIGTAAFTGTLPWQGQDGSATAPAFSFSADTNTGIYRSGADTLNLVTGGSTRFQVGASGQLGVGGATYGTSGYPLLSQGSGAAPQWVQVGPTGIDLTASYAWTGEHYFSAVLGTTVTPNGVNLGAGSAGGKMRLVSASAAADSKVWEIVTNTTDLIFRLVKDDGTSPKGALQFTRSTTSITAMAYGNATDNPPHTFYGDILAQSLVRLKNYTVATLPAGTQGDTAYVTDALAPTFLAAVVGGGAVVTPVFYDGSNWVAH